MKIGRVALCVQRVGPYHQARFAAAAKSLELHVIEFRARDGVYAWDPVTERGGYERRTVDATGVNTELERLDPEIVVTVGYADPEVQCAALWAVIRRRPLVVCSDSTWEDEPRRAWKEFSKRWIVRAFDAGLVAGSRSTDYLVSLGLSRDRIHRAWDVVDNDYFSRGAAAARASEEVTRRRLGLPRCYWLAVARFVPKKNLERLIVAYAMQVRRGADRRRALVLSGAGPLEPVLRERARTEGVEKDVYFPGFLQYPDLPACYGLADALILPSMSDQWGLVVNEAMAAGLPVLVSTSAGCAPDLVEPERNGLRFDPGDATAIAAALDRVAKLDDEERMTWGRHSRKIVDNYSLETFVSGLTQALAVARARPRQKSAITRLALTLLARRRVS